MKTIDKISQECSLQNLCGDVVISYAAWHVPNKTLHQHKVRARNATNDSEGQQGSAEMKEGPFKREQAIQQNSQLYENTFGDSTFSRNIQRTFAYRSKIRPSNCTSDELTAYSPLDVNELSSIHLSSRQLSPFQLHVNPTDMNLIEKLSTVSITNGTNSDHETERHSINEESNIQAENSQFHCDETTNAMK